MNRIVNKIVSKYHSRNPIDIAQGMNIKVAYADLGENVHGFYPILQAWNGYIHQQFT